MKKTHPTHGEVTVVKEVNETESLVKLANGVEAIVTTSWLKDVAPAA
jgi:hypothetical protein